MHDVGFTCHVMNVLLMHVVGYSVHVEYEVSDACDLFVSLLSLCEIMGLQMYIALVGLDWDYE